jgi:hypothetical protein
MCSKIDLEPHGQFVIKPTMSSSLTVALNNLVNAKREAEALLQLEKAAFWNRDALLNDQEKAHDKLEEAQDQLDEEPDNEDLREQVEEYKEELENAKEKFNEALEYHSDVCNRMFTAKKAIDMYEAEVKSLNMR